MEVRVMENNLTAIGARHEKNCEVIDLTCVQDERLSWKAKGIFNYLVTRPPYWTVNEADMIGRSKDGINSLNSGIKELTEFGYMFRIVKCVNGRITKWAYLITEIPCTNEDIVAHIPEGYKLHSKSPRKEDARIIYQRGKEYGKQ